MKNLLARFVLSLGLLALASVAQGQALTVTGLTDKTVYADSVTFTVQTQAGYDYLVLVDTNQVSAGVAVTVSRVEYHELQVFRTNQATLGVTNRLIRFIVRSSERATTENGIPPWTPYPPINSASNEFAGATLRLVMPQDFPAGYEIPVVVWIENAEGHAVRVNGSVGAVGHPSIAIRRGVGSGFLSGTNPGGSVVYAPHIRQLEVSNTVNLETNTTWTSVSGTLNGATVWPENSRIAVTGGLTIPAGSTLTIGAGSVVRLNAGVDINLKGSLVINGATNRPVVFMPVSRAQPWGGFLLEANTSQITGTAAIFTGSGAVANWFGSNGRPSSHRVEQSLFYCSNSPAITLSDSAAISLAGQLGHAYNGGTLTLNHFLMQRTTSGGEFTGASFRVNDSAFIECPDDSVNFVDGDNDALYIWSGTHGFTNTLFGWTKDDGVDSGGAGAGLLNFQNCWFESTFHEGNSLSATAKIVNHYGDVFINCGQGLEVGYDGPVGNLFGCLSTANLTGARFGDNYDWSYSGFLRATNSIIINNHRDVWGMIWLDWTYWTNSMDIQGNYLSVPNLRHPNNATWQPAEDGWRLASFATTPPGADVGVGLAVRSTLFDFSAITNAMPVRLSSFTTNLVTVDYTVESPGQVLASGTIQFQPGETLKFIPGLAAPSNADMVRMGISNPNHAELTGANTAYFVRNAAASSVTLVSTGSVWRYLDTGVNAGTAWRTNGFDDSAWLSGPGELGYGDSDEATLIRSSGVSGRIITTYFRREFEVAAPEAVAALTVRLKRDDGGIVYLNGTEVFKCNITNAVVDYLTRAVLASDDGKSWFATNVPPALLQSGTNLLAVEIHQESTTSSDVSFDLSLDATPKPTLQLTHFGTAWLLYWTDSSAILQQCENLNGPWSDVQSSSPVEADMSSVRKFYRLRRPASP